MWNGKETHTTIFLYISNTKILVHIDNFVIIVVFHTCLYTEALVFVCDKCRNIWAESKRLTDVFGKCLNAYGIRTSHDMSKFVYDTSQVRNKTIYNFICINLTCHHFNIHIIIWLHIVKLLTLTCFLVWYHL